MHVWQVGEEGAGAGAGARERRPQTSGPFSPVRPLSGWRGQSERRARGTGLTAAAREAGRQEGGGAARGGRSCPRARRRRSVPHPRAQPRHETLTARGPRCSGTPGLTDRGGQGGREDRGPAPSAGGGLVRRLRAVSSFARQAPAPAVRVAVSPHLGCCGGSGGRGAPGGWLCVANAGKRYPGLLLAGRRSARPGAPAWAGAPPARRTGGGGLRWLFRGSVRQPCNGRRREEGRRRGEPAESEPASGRRASWLAPRPGAKWRAGLEGNFCGRVRPGARRRVPARGGRACRQPQVVPAKSFTALLSGRRGRILESVCFLRLWQPHLTLSYLEH